MVQFNRRTFSNSAKKGEVSLDDVMLHSSDRIVHKLAV